MGPFGFEREPCVFFASFAGLLAEVLTAIDPLIYNPREDNVGRLSSQIIGVQEKKSTPEPIVNGPVSFQFGNCPLEVCPPITRCTEWILKTHTKKRLLRNKLKHPKVTWPSFHLGAPTQIKW